MVSPINSPRPPTLVNGDAFGIIIAYGPLRGSMKFHTPGGVTRTLFSLREQLSVKKFPFSLDEMMDQWNNLLPEETKGLSCPSELTCIASLGLIECVNKVEIRRKKDENMYQSTMEALAQACKHYANLAKENRRLLEQNIRLEERLTIVENDVERLHGVIVGEQVDKIVLETSLKKMDEEYKVAISNSANSHEEALEKYKRDTM
ncbi:hypothetical protein J1N35_018899 [Gossypium stocksii]|uniref:Uncharacterized protein n=1 Tax=Gossypium stocksii TaxID=47602 RepID=A0A9D4A5D5_9ROSI|nr:hypothetical protein J1N35_018899 [Gossypium stocksii]